MNKKRLVALMLFMAMVLSIFVPLDNVFAQSNTSTRQASDSIMGRWTVGNQSILRTYSMRDLFIGTLKMKYLGTEKYGNTESIKIELAQAGKFGTENPTLDELRKNRGWSYYAFHFDDELYNAIDLSKSYVRGDSGRTFYFSNPGPREYRSDDKTIAVPLRDLYKDDGRTNYSQPATVFITLKPGHSLQKDEVYLMESRILGKARNSNSVYILNQITGLSDFSSDIPDTYNTYTNSLTIPYGRAVEIKPISNVDQNAMSTAYIQLSMDWYAQQLTVSYFYETSTATYNNGETQFAQIFPEEFLQVLRRDSRGRYAHYDHVYHRGDENWGQDYGRDFTKIQDFQSTGSSTSKGLAGFTLRAPTTQGNKMNSHRWRWLADLTKTTNPRTGREENIGPVKARYASFSATAGNLQNRMVYNIDTKKFREVFGNPENLSFESFLIHGNGIIKNSDAGNTAAVLRNVTNSPVVDEIFTDSKNITGNTKYNNTNRNISITASNFKNPVGSSTISANTDGSFNFSVANNSGVFGNLKKDQKLSFTTWNSRPGFFASKPTIQKVKARVYFNEYEEKNNKVVVVPSATKFRGEEGYVENGLGDLFPADPEKEKSEFLGWSNKKISSNEFEDLKKNNSYLRDVSQWNDSKAYIFDKDSPIDASYEVFPIWREDLKEVKLVLHKNYGDDEVREISVSVDENIPNFEEIDKADTYDAQLRISQKYSDLSKLPNAFRFATKGDDRNSDIKSEPPIFSEKVENGQRYSMVGWSLKSDNGEDIIEDLFSNNGIISKKVVDGKTKFFLTKVNTKTKSVGQASGAKNSVEIIPDKNGEVHLYAAWKPYFNLRVTKTWHDATSDEFKSLDIKKIFENLAHNTGMQAPKIDYKNNIKVGLLSRVAVTEAADPTYDEKANYYLPDFDGEDSIKNLGSDGTVSWQVPGYNEFGKRYSYIAVEFDNTPEGEKKYRNFSQKWTSLWTKVYSNLDENGEKADASDSDIVKIQTLNVKKDDGEIDAFSGATVRKLTEDGKPVQVVDSLARSKVSSKGNYETMLYNVKTAISIPNLLPIYEGDGHLYFEKNNDGSANVIEFILPEYSGSVYFIKDGDSWKRAKKGEFEFEVDPSKTDLSITEEDGNYKLNLDPRYTNKFFKAKQEVIAKYHSKTNAKISLPAVRTVIPRSESPRLENLKQGKIVIRDNVEYVPIRAPRPTADLGQFTAGAKIRLIDANNKEVVPYKDLDGSDVVAVLEGSDYVFYVPKSQLNHEDEVTAYNEDVNKTPTRSITKTKLDLKAPEISTRDISAYIGEPMYEADVVKTDEPARISFDTLPEGLRFIPLSNKTYNEIWDLGDEISEGVRAQIYPIKIGAEDEFGNKSNEKVLNIDVKARGLSSTISATQVPNVDEKPSFMLGQDAVVGSLINVYLDKTGEAVFNKQITSPYDIVSVYEYLRDEIEKTGSVYITQVEVDKNESERTEVKMDVVPPELPEVSVKPYTSKIEFSNIPDDLYKFELEALGRKYVFTKDEDNRWFDLSGEEYSVVDGRMTVDFKRVIYPNDWISYRGYDKMLNYKYNNYFVYDIEYPDNPSGDAFNSDRGNTYISGISEKNEGGVVNIYLPKIGEDGEPEFEMVSVPKVGEDGTYIEDEDGDVVHEEVKRLKKDENTKQSLVVKGDSTYEGVLSKRYPVGTILLIEAQNRDKTSNLVEVKVRENSDIIPFDPNDEKDPNKENPDPNRYVKVSLDANGGDFNPGTKSSFYVLKTYKLTEDDFNNARINLNPPIGRIFKSWSFDLEGKNSFESRVFEEDATIYAQYGENKDVIPFNPNDEEDPNKENPDPNRYITISLDANGGSFKEGTKSSYHVRKGYALKEEDLLLAKESLIPPKDKIFREWSLNNSEPLDILPNEGRAFTQDSIIYAQYSEGRDIIPSTGNEKPDGYVIVEYKAGENSKIAQGDETKYYVNPKANLALRAIPKPTIIPNAGYNVGYPAWKSVMNRTSANDSTIVVSDIVSTSQVYDKDKVIAVVDKNTTKPEGYLSISFDKGEHGKLEGITKYYVKEGVKSSEVPVPSIIPNSGYEAIEENGGWDKVIPETYSGDFTAVAQYKILPPTSDKPVAGYTRVEFVGGEHGKVVERDNKKSVIYVNPEIEVVLDSLAPEVLADQNYSFKAWDRDLSKGTKYIEETKITATYESDISTEPKDGYVLVSFDPGENGTITEGNKDIYVNKSKEVDLTEKAPKVVGKNGYTYLGWKEGLKGVFAEPTTIHATYLDPDDISTKPVEGYTHIKFVDGEEVKLVKGAVTDYWVNPEKVVSIPAPDVKPNPGFRFSRWSTSLTQKFTEDVNIKPLSAVDEDVTTIPDESKTKITFRFGDHGKFDTETITVFYATREKQVTIVQPDVIADTGYFLRGWVNSNDLDTELPSDKAIVTTFGAEEKEVEYIAQYGKYKDIEESYTPGYKEVRFNAGKGATLNVMEKVVDRNTDKLVKTGKVLEEGLESKSYWVNPTIENKKKLKDLNYPEVVLNNGYEYDVENGYKAEDEKSWYLKILDLDTTIPVLNIDKPMEFVANIKSKGAVEDNEEAPKEWKYIKFAIFEYDKDKAEISSGITEYRVDPELENNYLTPPTVKILKEGYSVEGWSGPISGKFERDDTIYALIGGDISYEPKSGFAKISFTAGKDGKFADGAKTTVYVRKDKEVDLSPWVPEVVANKDYTHIGWNKPLKAKFNDDSTIEATYRQDIIENPTTPSPEDGYLRLRFEAGEHGSLEGVSVVDVSREAGLTLGDVSKPKVVAEDGWYNIGWDRQDSTKLDRNIFSSELVVTAKYDEDIIPVPSVDDPVKEGFVRVVFSAGLNGKFKQGTGQATIFDVRENSGKTLRDLTKPEIVANLGWSHTGWDKSDDTALNSSMTITAIYSQSIITNPTNPEPLDGYARVKFSSDGRGTLQGVSSYDVLIADKIQLGSLVKPTVVPKPGNTFSSWDRSDDQIITESMTVKALYGEDIVENPTGEVKDGYVRVVFKPDTKEPARGTLEGTTTFDVLIAANKSLGDLNKPKVIANEGYTFEKWNMADSLKFEKKYNRQTLEVSADYLDDVIENPTGPVSDKYARVTFNAGENGYIDGDKTSKTLAVLIAKKQKIGDIKSKISVEPNEGYAFDGWDKEDSLVIAGDTNVTAKYNKDIIENPSNPTPAAGYARVTWNTGEKGSFEDGSKVRTVDVLISSKKTLANIGEKKVVPINGYVFSTWGYVGFNGDEDEPITKNISANAIYTTGGDISDTEVKGFYKVTFKSGENADLSIGGQKNIKEKSYWINPKADPMIKLSQLEQPTIEPKSGYKVVEGEKWKGFDPERNVDADLEFTANLVSDGVIPGIGEKPDGWVTVKLFLAESNKVNAKLNGNAIFFVDPSKEVSLSVPKVELKNPRKKFAKWVSDDEKIQSSTWSEDSIKARFVVNTNIEAVLETRADEGTTKLNINPVKQGDTVVSGQTEPNAVVTVILGGKEVSTKAGEDGSFTIPISSQDAGTQLEVTAKAEGKEEGRNTIDVLPNIDGLVDAIEKGREKLEDPAYPEDKKEELQDAISKAEETVDALKDKTEPVEGYDQAKVDQDEQDILDLLGEKGQTKKPSVDPIADKSTSVSGKSEPNSEITITVGSQTYNTKSKSDGRFTVNTDEPMEYGTEVEVVAKAENKTESEPTKVTVGVDGSGLKEAIDQGTELLNGEDGKPKIVTTADKKLQDAIEEGKDLYKDENQTELNDGVTQEQVDAAEEKIREAMKEKEEADKIIEEAEKVLEDIEKYKEDNPEEYEQKPEEVKDKVEEDKGKIEDILDIEKPNNPEYPENPNPTEEKPNLVDPDKLKEEIDKAKEDFEEMARKTVEISAMNVSTTSNEIRITTFPVKSDFEIKINGQVVKTGMTDPYESYSLGLIKPLKRGDKIEISAKTEGFNKGYYRTVVFR